MDKRFALGFYILLVVSCATFFLHSYPANIEFYNHDFQFHFFDSGGKGLNPNQYVDQDKLDSYAPVSAWIFAPFSFNARTYYLAIILVFVVIFGLLLVYLSKHWIAALFWVASSAPYFFIEGVIAQGILTLLLLLFVFSGFKLRVILLFVALLTHSFGLWLLIFYWLTEIALTTKWKNIVLGVCGTSFFPAIDNGKKTVVFGKVYETNKTLLGTQALNYSSYVYIFRWFFMFPLSVFGFVGLWKLNKTWFWFCLIGFFGAFAFLYWRVVESLIPFIILGLVEYYKTKSNKYKALLIIACLGMIAIQLANYYSITQNVHLSLTTIFFNFVCNFGVLK